MAALAALVLAAVCGGMARADRLGVLTMPELGHFNPLLSIVEAFVEQAASNTATLFCPNFFEQECAKYAKHLGDRVTCKGFTNYTKDKYDEVFFEKLVVQPALDTFELIEAESANFQLTVAEDIAKVFKSGGFDYAMADFTFHAAAAAVADASNLPLILLWPLVLELPGENRNPRVPSIGLAFSVDVSWPKQMVAALLQRISLVIMSRRASVYDEMRAELGVKPDTALAPYRNQVLLTPSIWGLDPTQPLHPNTVPVGFLQPATSDDAPLDADWAAWIRECTAGGKGIVYANMGSIGELPKAWVQMFERGLRNVTLTTGRCVLWKLHTRQQKYMQIFGKGEHASTERVTKWLPFSPRVLFREKAIAVFLTHCGDTSVYETVQFGAAFVGFGLFADQPDMCARIEDAKLGYRLDKATATSDDIADAIVRAAKLETSARQRMSRLRMVSKLLGEHKRAAAYIAFAGKHGSGMLTRPVHHLWKDTDADVVVGFAAVLYGFGVLFSRLAGFVRRSMFSR